MLCCFGSCAVFPYLACSRNSALFFFSSLFFMISHRMIATHIHNDIYVCTRLYKHSRRPGPLRSFPPPHFPRSPLSLSTLFTRFSCIITFDGSFSNSGCLLALTNRTTKRKQEEEKKRGGQPCCVCGGSSWCGRI